MYNYFFYYISVSDDAIDFSWRSELESVSGRMMIKNSEYEYYSQFSTSGLSKSYVNENGDKTFCNFDLKKIGDHICDPEIAENKFCCYDKGDCDIIDLNGSKNQTLTLCPTCSSSIRHQLGDGFCDEELKTEQCCYDLGDCVSEECTLELVVQGLRYGNFHIRYMKDILSVHSGKKPKNPFLLLIRVGIH